jgi:hypothetical protein
VHSIPFFCAAGVVDSPHLIGHTLGSSAVWNPVAASFFWRDDYPEAEAPLQARSLNPSNISRRPRLCV